jgi:hypothetical protein
VDDVISTQVSLCRKYGVEYVPCQLHLKIGISKHFDSAKYPLNGLRHPLEGDTTGWYIWSGEEFSNEPDFFVPMHAIHLVTKAHELLKYLGLAPGWRFLIAPNHEDVWEDIRLLKIQ